MATQMTPKELASAMADFVNSFGSRAEMEDVAKELQCQHRTLQQQVFRLFLTTCQEWAAAGKRGDFDLRNQYTVESAQKIMDLLGGPGVPFI